MHMSAALGHLYHMVPAPANASFEAAFSVDPEAVVGTALQALDRRQAARWG